MALFLQSIKLYPIALSVYSPSWDLSCPQQSSFLKPVCCYYYYYHSFWKKIRVPDGIETHVAFLICLHVGAWCSYESHVLVLIWQCDCMMQLWVTRSCPDLTMWLRDAVMSHTCLSWSDYLTVWCSYESHVLVLIWVSDCVMLLWVTRACPDLTIWLHDADLVKDPYLLSYFTLARLRIFSSLVVRASD